MKCFKQISLAIVSIILFGTVVSFINSVKSKVSIRFSNYVGNAVLKVDSAYTNQLGQPFTVTNIKYYISHITFKQANGAPYFVREYYLVNEQEEDSKQINLSDVPEGEYTSMEFIIGVDSLHNCSGVQSGALDPLNGMFWAWNTGYIFLKFDGTSPVSKSQGNTLEFHIGGYKSPSNCIRKVTLSFKTPLLLTANTTKEINMKADILQIFKSPTVIDFSKLSSVTDFHNATTVADNYASMFSLIEK